MKVRLFTTATVLALGFLALSAAGMASEQPDANKLPPVEQTPDLEALRQIIREELKAEQATKACEPDSKLKLEAIWENGFHAQTADDAFRIHIGGRAEFDNSWYTQDPNLLLGTTNKTRLTDGTLFRRARLRADGLLWGWIDFVTEVNFANIQDVSNVDNQECRSAASV